MRRTKIIATLGPSCETPEQLDALVAAGMDVARLDLSAGDHEEHARACRNVREAAHRAGRPIAVLLDLVGPRIWVRCPPGPALDLPTGSEVLIDGSPAASAAPDRLLCDHRDLADDVRASDPILLDGGRIRLEVIAVQGRAARCRVAEGGQLPERADLRLPRGQISLPSLTLQDRDDLAFGVERLGVDFVALSSVRTAEDVRLARRLTSDRVPILAKIEKCQALDALDEILLSSAGCLVARAQLSIELPLDRVPLLQKEIIDRANLHGRLSIVTTQILESMVDRPVPTRAELADVANAVLDGVDAVQLSAETATGSHPVEAVRCLARLLEQVEASPRYQSLPEAALARKRDTVSTAVARAAVAASRQLGLKAIAVYTRSGELARMVSDLRPPAPIIAYTAQEAVWRRGAALWGIESRRTPAPFHETDRLVKYLTDDLLARGVAEPGDPIAIVSSTPPDRAGFGASMLQIVVL
jgi:pyruvate kinase